VQYVANLSKKRTAVAVLVLAVTLALAATAVGYAALGKTVTLSLDGQAREIRSTGATVEEVLEDEGLELTDRDVVAPSLDTEVTDGTRIAVRFARPLDLNVDGDEKRHWVTATDVATALDQVGIRARGAELSASRGAAISRSGMSLTVVTPKKVTFVVGGKKPVTEKVTALTVREALKDQKIKVDRDDELNLRPRKVVEKGDRIVVTKVEVVTKRVDDETIPFSTETESDSSLYKGEKKTVREGKAGSRDVTYRLRYENGQLVKRTVVRQHSVVEAVNALVRVGTKERAPEPAAPAFYAGNSVWDRLAQC
jgi:resuscitation-promoting factor RpfB